MQCKSGPHPHIPEDRSQIGCFRIEPGATVKCVVTVLFTCTTHTIINVGSEGCGHEWHHAELSLKHCNISRS